MESNTLIHSTQIKLEMFAGNNHSRHSAPRPSPDPNQPRPTPDLGSLGPDLGSRPWLASLGSEVHPFSRSEAKERVTGVNVSAHTFEMDESA